VIAGVGRLERIYFLTETGVKYAAESLRIEPSEIVYPRYGVQFKNDYFHRKLFIDFHISLRLWENQEFDREVEFFNSYYTKGKNKQSINMIRFKPSDHLPPHYRKTIDPDGVFRFSKKGLDTPLLCAMELHRKHDTKYITKQLDEHITAIDQMLLPEYYGQDKPNIVLSVHESLGSFRGVQARLKELPDFKNFLPYFHFNLTENIETNLKKGHGNIANGWITADEKPSLLFS